MVGEIGILVIAIIILFGGFKKTLQKLEIRDFVAIFFLLTTAFINLFKAPSITSKFSLAIGGLLFFIICCYLYGRKVITAKNSLSIIGIFLIVALSFLIIFFMEKYFVNTYLIYFSLVVLNVILTFIFTKDTGEGFCISFISSTLGFILGYALRGDRVLLFGGVSFSLAIISAVFSALAIFTMQAILSYYKRKKQSIKFESGKFVEREDEKEESKDYKN